MKCFATDDKGNFLISNGDLYFLYKERSILHLSKVLAQTIHGELPGYPDRGVLDISGKFDSGRFLWTLFRLISSSKSLPGVTDVSVTYYVRNNEGVAVYTLVILTVYSDESYHLDVLDLT